MAIGDLKKKGSFGNKGSGNSYDEILGGIALKLSKIEEVDGKPVLNGTVIAAGSKLQAGQEISVGLSELTAAKIQENLKRGQGRTTGSVLLLENCRRNAEGQIITRWATTAISSLKAQDEFSGHDMRQVKGVYVETPVISFNNPSQGLGEPEKITWSLTNETRSFWDSRAKKAEVFDRAWLQDKLSQAGSARVTAVIVDPEESTRVANTNEALKAIASALSKPNGMAIARVHDENGDIIESRIKPRFDATTKQYDVAATIAHLQDSGIFRNFGNADIDDNMTNDAGVVFEVVAAKEVPFLGDTLNRVLTDVRTKPLNDLTGFNAVYGKDSGGQAVDAIVTLIPTKNGGVCFASDPIPMDRNRVPLRYVHTAHFDLTKPEKTAEAAPVTQSETPAVTADDEFTAYSNAVASDTSFDPAADFDEFEFDEGQPAVSSTRRFTR